MAITQINPVTNSLSETITAQNKVYKTQADITLSEFDTTAAPQVQAGSIFANNGTLFENDSDATPTGYAGISVSTTFYLYYDESGGVFIYAETAPTWSDDKQGYYNGNDRAFFSMYKDSGGTLYENKRVYKKQTLNPVNLSTKIIDIGVWNMNTTTDVWVVHGLADPSSIRTISVVILADANASMWQLDKLNTSNGQPSGYYDLYGADTTEIRLHASSTGLFNSAAYESTGINRGYITIQYLE